MQTIVDILYLYVIWKSLNAVRHIYLFSYFPGISSEFDSWEENMLIQTDDVENNFLLQEKRFVFLRRHCHCKLKSKYFPSHIFYNTMDSSVRFIFWYVCNHASGMILKNELRLNLAVLFLYEIKHEIVCWKIIAANLLANWWTPWFPSSSYSDNQEIPCYYVTQWFISTITETHNLTLLSCSSFNLTCSLTVVLTISLYLWV
jgi:hypothetical protein